MKYKIQFSVWYETEVECLPEELRQIATNLNIPEDEETKYVADTVELESVTDEDGNEVEV